MTLTIRDEARREIQKDVDALTQSPKHYNIKADRARSYFPIIEKIFAEEGVPEDFKFLVLQESSLIADAVSVSNAVGFWQFKDFTAIEMGLRIDRDIDERMNIAASTRAAARYIRKNNAFFDNWLYALQAYQMGAGGVMRSVPEPHSGERHAEITSKTYWYVKKFLAYKIAFEEGVKGKGQTELMLFENKTSKSLADISREMAVSEEELRNYNKWVKTGNIPGDRPYMVLIPYNTGIRLPELMTVAKTDPKSETVKAQVSSEGRAQMQTTKINGIRAVLALEGESAAKLAARANVDLASFLRWNEISYSTAIIPNTYYFLGKKRGRAEEDFHTLAAGEDLWTVSQKYGVRVKKVKRYNRLQASHVEKGMTLWLASMKPKSANEPVTTGNVVEVEMESFNWSGEPETTVVSTVQQPVVVQAPVVPEFMPDNTENLKAADSLKTLQLAQETENSADTTVGVYVVRMQDSKTHHVVQAKETLYGIAKVYDVAVMDLVAWNDLDLQQGLRVGQVLKIAPDQAAPQAVVAPKELVHEVRASDTLFSIARKYGVTIKEIMEWNEKKDFSLSVGEKLKVKALQ